MTDLELKAARGRKDIHREELAELRRTGLVRLPRVTWIDEFVSYLADKPKYPGHIKARPRPGIYCNSMADLLCAPHFLAFAKSFTPLVSQYFGERAHLWSLNAFYTDENTPYIKGVNGLHIDTEAPKVVVLFIFGSFVGLHDGVQIVANGPYAWDAIRGPAGTSWLADTGQFLHCGLLPKTPRMIAWARFANVIPEAKFTEELPDIP